MSSPSRPTRTAALLLAALALTACGGAGPRTGALDKGAQGAPGSPNTGANAAHPVCRVHQRVLPGRDYTGGKDGDPLAVLDMLRYYTAQHALPFCDHKPPTSQDTVWTGLYDRLTAK